LIDEHGRLKLPADDQTQGSRAVTELSNKHDRTTQSRFVFVSRGEPLLFVALKKDADRRENECPLLELIGKAERLPLHRWPRPASQARR
jgi:hypothetical protein